MDRLPTVLMIASFICLAIAAAFLVMGAIGHDLKRVELRDNCTMLGGVVVKDYYDNVYCIDKKVLVTPLN